MQQAWISPMRFTTQEAGIANVYIPLIAALPPKLKNKDRTR
jgi:hypothetical protein